MSVVFKRTNPYASVNSYYQIVITLPNTQEPGEELKATTRELVEVLKNADLDEHEHCYIYLMDLLHAIIPDRDTFLEVEETPVGKDRFDLTAMAELFLSRTPQEISLSLCKALTYIYNGLTNQATNGGKRNAEIEQAASDLKLLQAAIESVLIRKPVAK